MTNQLKLKKSLIMLVSAAILTCFLSACGCNHEWEEATCIQPRTCRICGETEGKALGHDYEEATCTMPKTCIVCGETEGEALGHDYEEATCTTPKTCIVCGETEGEELGHDFVDGYCTRCGLEDPDYFNPEEYGFINNYGMTKWIEVTEYSIKTEDTYATFAESGYGHRMYEFKNNVIYYYWYETSKLWKTSSYSIVNNDSINENGSAITIFDRAYDSNGNLIIKAMFDGIEKWFILEEQIDWDKSPVVEDENYKYYFK